MTFVFGGSETSDLLFFAAPPVWRSGGGGVALWGQHEPPHGACFHVQMQNCVTLQREKKKEQKDKLNKNPEHTKVCFHVCKAASRERSSLDETCIYTQHDFTVTSFGAFCWMCVFENVYFMFTSELEAISAVS